jgi:zinc transporter ZupT
MCTVSVLELYPEAIKHVSPDSYPSMTTGTVCGMAIMIATEWYLP